MSKINWNKINWDNLLVLVSALLITEGIRIQSVSMIIIGTIFALGSLVSSK